MRRLHSPLRCRWPRRGRALRAWIGWLCAGVPAFSAAVSFVDRPVPLELHQPYPLPSEAANDVRALATGSDGVLWAGTRAGVWMLHARDRVWQPVDGPGTTAPVLDLAVGADGRVWVGTIAGLRVLSTSALPAPTSDRESEAASFTGRPVDGIDGPVAAVAAAAGRVLAGGPDGYWMVQGTKAAPIDLVCPRYLGALGADRHGTWWIATAMGLYQFDPREAAVGNGREPLAGAGAGGGLARYVGPEFENQSAALRALAFDGSGRLWTVGLGGVGVVHRGRWHAYLTPENGLPCADVRCVAPAPDGSVWFGTAAGAARFDGRRWAWRSGRRWLVHPEVRDMAVDDRGTVWAATAGGVSALVRTNVTLLQKANHYHAILESRHVRAPGLVGPCRLRTPGDVRSWEPTDDDNDGGYTAVCLAMESLRYAVTRDPHALANARRAFTALEFLQQVTGTPGFFARTVIPADWKEMHDPNERVPEDRWAEERVRDPRNKRVPERWRLSADGRWLWKGDTSSDELTAHFFGYYVFHEKAADAADRLRVRDQVCRIVDHLLEHGLQLTDLDGQPTRWGVWAPEKLNGDPNWAMERGINSVEILSFLKLAHHLSSEPKYLAAYRRLIQEHGYDRNVREAPNLNPAWRTHIDFELLAFAYPALLDLERNPRLRRAYRTSFERWYDAVKEEHNPFFEFLAAAHSGRHAADLAGAVAFLRDAPLDLVRWDVDNSKREDVELKREPEVEAWQTSRVLPPSEIEYSRTDRNPWLAVQGDGAMSEGDGVYWLLPYWMGRQLGILRSK